MYIDRDHILKPSDKSTRYLAIPTAGSQLISWCSLRVKEILSRIWSVSTYDPWRFMQVNSGLMPPHDEDTTKFTPIAQALYFQLMVRKIFLGCRFVHARLILLSSNLSQTGLPVDLWMGYPKPSTRSLTRLTRQIHVETRGGCKLNDSIDTNLRLVLGYQRCKTENRISIRKWDITSFVIPTNAPHGFQVITCQAIWPSADVTKWIFPRLFPEEPYSLPH